MDWVKKKKDVNDLINWHGLTSVLDDADTLILKFVYYPFMKTTTHGELLKHLNKNRNKTFIGKDTLRKKLYELQEDLLLFVIKSKPLVIRPIYQVSEANMKNLLIILSRKYQFERLQ